MLLHNSYETRHELVSDFNKFSLPFPTLSQEIINITARLENLAKCDSIGSYEETNKLMRIELEMEYEKTNSLIQLIKKENADYLDNLVEEYLHYGRPADAEVQLPIGKGDKELNVEAMLEQMRIIVDSGAEYDLMTHNCSSTALMILTAGEEGKAHAPPLGVVTPQIVYNKAMALRDSVCKISIEAALAHLDEYYSSISNIIRIIPRKYDTLYEAIINFAVDNIFPQDVDLENKSFYVFSERDRENLIYIKDELIPTELLRDLWGIIPMRTLPMSEDGSNNVVIDKNMTIGEVVQGLAILAQKNTENRLKLVSSEQNDKKDPYILLKNKIESVVEHLVKKANKNTILYTITFLNTCTTLIKKLDTEIPPKTSKEKSEILYKEIMSHLKGLNLFEAPSIMKDVTRGARQYTTLYKQFIKDTAEKKDENEVTVDPKNNM